jgi:hypothetical protein
MLFRVVRIQGVIGSRLHCKQRRDKVPRWYFRFWRRRLWKWQDDSLQVIALCSLLELDRRFGGLYWPNYQGFKLKILRYVGELIWVILWPQLRQPPPPPEGAVCVTCLSADRPALQLCTTAQPRSAQTGFQNTRKRWLLWKKGQFFVYTSLPVFWYFGHVLYRLPQKSLFISESRLKLLKILRL